MADILASAARTASGTSTTFPIKSSVQSARFQVNLTAAATATGDTLDVYIQTTVDGGTTWDDQVHFTQMLGNGGAQKFVASWVRSLAPAGAQRAPRDASMAAGVEQGPCGSLGRVKWVIVSATAPSFTFSVAMDAQISR